MSAQVLRLRTCRECKSRVAQSGRAHCAHCDAYIDRRIAEARRARGQRSKVCPGCGGAVQSSVIAEGLDIESWHYECLTARDG